MQTQQITHIQATESARMTTGVKEFDNFIGGGFVNGETILIAGQPGAGKSTLLLQLATILTDTAERVLYISGEESLEQIKLRADRLGTLRDSIFCSDQVVLEDMYEVINKINPKFIIVDSLQMIHSKAIKGEQGSARQMKHCLLDLIAHVKKTGQVLIVIGHSTKTGLIAGMLTLQHMVDAVFFVSKEGDVRYIQAKKNRFGGVDEQFQMLMTQKGFKEFTRSIVKGSQVQRSILPYLRHKYGDEVRLTKADIEAQMKSGLPKLFLHVAIGFVEKLFFGQTIKQDYEIVFKLK